MKLCSTCKGHKPPSEFPVRRVSRDGLNASCKTCKNAGNRGHYGGHKAAHIARAKRNERRRRQVVPGYGAALDAWKTLTKSRRVPGWAKLADFLPIYAERAALGPGYEVDHIIPLNGELVSGLHVPENLQILTREQNQAKGNSYEPR